MGHYESSDSKWTLVDEEGQLFKSSVHRDCMNTERIEYNALIFHLFIKQSQRSRVGRLGTDFPRIIPLLVIPITNLQSGKSLRKCDQWNYPAHQRNQGPELRKNKPQPVHIHSLSSAQKPQRHLRIT
ncbi:hypothetical protein KIL84_013267 [Mauremys mutica]|uniref:Uncharacterized protein n=1 Tax=Mauremys mutica TaxID=74926 RepID=A0A9D3WX45_9SAUR|nr:hypothetical protein KIL84_013267 [Mauremys mutica]